MQNNFLTEMREHSRERYYEIWQKVKAGEELEGEEKIIGELMEQHEEYYEHWDSTNFNYEYDPEKDEVNPFMHLMLDTIVMKQLTANEPKQTKFIYNKLTAQGDTHLEAIHKIAYIAAEQIWEIMQEGKEFNEKNTSEN